MELVGAENERLGGTDLDQARHGKMQVAKDVATLTPSRGAHRSLDIYWKRH